MIVQSTSNKCVLRLFVICALTLGAVSSQFVFTSDHLKGQMFDWSIKMYNDFGPAVPLMFGDLGSVPIIRDRKGVRDDFANNDGTGLSALLPMDCKYKECVKARQSSQCTAIPADDELNMKKLVIRRREDYSWVVECRRFLKVVLPEEAGGTPGRRTLGDDEAERGRLTSNTSTEVAGTGATVTGAIIKVPKVAGLQTPSLQPVSTEDKNGSGLMEQEKVVTPSPEECRNLFNTDLDEFHNECCLKAGPGVNLKDHRCSVKSLLEKAMAGQKPTVASDSSDDVVNPVVFEEDVSDLGKTLDVLEDEAKKNEVEDGDSVIIEEITQQKDGWRHEYYVVLGFFLVFMALFLIVVAVLVYKLKQNNKTMDVGVAQPSPGLAPGGLNLTQQRARGYSAIDDDEGDRAALTPATEQAQAFQY